jgi:hypothetical protein
LGCSPRLRGGGGKRSGGTAPADRNTISGNAFHGVFIDGSDGNFVQGNYIGTNAAGTAIIPNGTTAFTDGNGVFIDGGANNTVGGPAAGAGNVISGNLNSGVYILGLLSTGNLVAGNFIGPDSAGTAPLINLRDGVSIDNAPSNTVGGTTAAHRNLLSGNLLAGAAIFGPDAQSNIVLGNHCGLGSGGAALGNGDNGVFIGFGAHDNTVGGTVAGARNIISGNDDQGVRLLDAGTGNSVLGNYIGTDVTGTFTISNGLVAGNGGVYVTLSAGNFIGGSAPGSGNLISGNIGDGILVEDNTGLVIAGNIIGLNAAGNAALGNNNSGIYTGGGGISNLVIGGLGNVISGNLGHGIEIDGADFVEILGNKIGTDITGLLPVPNGGSGIFLENGADFIDIGDGTDGEANVVSANLGNGIQSVDSFEARIRRNFIGVGIDGVTPLGNGGHGVFIVTGSINRVTNANVIRNNGGAGVAIDNFGTGNLIVANSIFNNAGLGIDLNNDGVSPNDPGDADGGANETQNFPVITSAVLNPDGTITVNYDLDTFAGNIRVDFYLNSAPDPSGFGEGELWRDTVIVAHAGGVASYSRTFAGVPGLPYVTTTATDSNNNTSEFSAAVRALPAPNPMGNTAPTAKARILDPLNGLGFSALVHIAPAATQGSTFLDATQSTDPEGDLLSFDWSIDGVIVATGPAPQITMPPGEYLILLTASDGFLIDWDVVLLRINHRPTANAGPDDVVTALNNNGAPYTFAGSASDAEDVDPSLLTYQWLVNGNPVANSNSPTPTILLPPGINICTLRVTDQLGGISQDQCTIIVNRAPIADAGPDQSVFANSPAGVNVSLNGGGSSDPDGDPLTYSWVYLVGAGPAVPAVQDPTILLPPGSYTLELTVTDPFGASTTDTVDITVTLNNAPVADAGADRTVKLGFFKKSVVVALNGTLSSDPDGDPLTFSWVVLSGPQGAGVPVIPNGPTPSVSLKKGTYTIQLTVTDIHGATSTDTVVITVKGSFF